MSLDTSFQVSDAIFVAVDVLIALVGILGGWWMKVIYQNMRDLQAADHELSNKVRAIEVLVVGDYAKRAEVKSDLERLSTALFQKLDRIEDMVSGKADKASYYHPDPNGHRG